jgi:hypothetical protein
LTSAGQAGLAFRRVEPRHSRDREFASSDGRKSLDIMSARSAGRRPDLHQLGTQLRLAAPGSLGQHVSPSDDFARAGTGVASSSVRAGDDRGSSQLSRASAQQMHRKSGGALLDRLARQGCRQVAADGACAGQKPKSLERPPKAASDPKVDIEQAWSGRRLMTNPDMPI